MIENIKKLLDNYKYEDIKENYLITIGNNETNEVYITLNRSLVDIIIHGSDYTDSIEKNEFNNFTYLKDFPEDLENTILKMTMESETLNDMIRAFDELESEKSKIIDELESEKSKIIDELESGKSKIIDSETFMDFLYLTNSTNSNDDMILCK